MLARDRFTMATLGDGMRRHDERPATAAAILPDLTRPSPNLSAGKVSACLCSLDGIVLGAVALCTSVLSATGNADAVEATARLTTTISALYLLIAFCSGCYDLPFYRTAPGTLPRTLQSWTVTVLLGLVVTKVLHAPVVAPLPWLAVWFVAAGFSLVAVHAATRSVVRQIRASGGFDRRSAIVGTGKHATALADYLSSHPDLMVRICGFYGDAHQAEHSDRNQNPHHRLCGDLKALLRDIRQGRIDQVFVALPETDRDRAADIVAMLKTTPVCVRSRCDDLTACVPSNQVVVLGHHAFVTLSDRPLLGFDTALKTAADRIVALLALILLAPLMIIVGLAIRLEGPGPILFRQPREGYNCRVFHVLKFRTMHSAACEITDIVQARRGDPRVTRVGAFLRRTSLDELPQLFNVVLGDMSLIGPRPHALSTRAGATLFADVSAAYPARHRVKPGITGWAQVCGLRGQTDTEAKLLARLAHDLYYIEHWSIALDLLIIARTLVTVPFQRAH